MYAACVSRWMVLGLISFAVTTDASNAAISTAVVRDHNISFPFPSQGSAQLTGPDYFGVENAPAFRIEDPDLLVQHAPLQADDPDRDAHAAIFQDQYRRLPFFRQRRAILS